jgi:hypothetical protein
MLSFWVKRPGDRAVRFTGPTVLAAFKITAFSTLVAGLLSCGPGDPVPSGSGVSHIPPPAAKKTSQTAPSQDLPISSSPEIDRIVTRHALYLSDLKDPRGDLDPDEQKERYQRQEVLNRILSEPDPETRHILITWLTPVVEADSEAMQILKELQENDNPPNPKAEPSDGLMEPPGQDASAGEPGD